MRIMLLTGDRETAKAYRNAADETEGLRLCTVKQLAQALEWLFREPFDALLSDDPYIFEPRIRACPVLWPGSVCLLRREQSPYLRFPKEMTFCFPIDSDPKQVLQRTASFPCERSSHKSADVLISRFLQRVGVPVSMTGFDCMREAIRILLSLDRVTESGCLQDIYETVGASLRISASAAEHTARQAIGAAWIRADARLLEQLFGYTVDAERAAPSNAAFLFRAADHIRLQSGGGLHMTLTEMHEMEDELRGEYIDEDTLLNATINAVMRRLGVPAHYLGYRYIFLAVRYIRTQPQEKRSETKRDLYPYLEACVHSPTPMIHRTIHYAVTRAWQRADPEILYSYVGLRGKNLKDPPGNIEFIYLVAERVRLILGDTNRTSSCAERKAAPNSRIPGETD